MNEKILNYKMIKLYYNSNYKQFSKMENNDDDMDFNNVECQNIATNAVKLIVPDEKNAQAYQKDKVN